MSMNRREVLGAVGLGGATAALPAGAVSNFSAMPAPASGPFRADWKSLVDGYRAPRWFRDAKFGMWAHWGPQCVPEEGDWYARNMYIQGTRAHRAHTVKYGHPTEVGFIDVIGKWKAERWDPTRLMDLYQKAGARYFVAMANHHDNLDMFASTHNPWNTTRVGPMRDIVGTWAKLARERGLRFGVSNHSSHSWHWYQTAYGYDPEGPYAGKRYDAWRLTSADGRGKYWEGLDPQALYTGRTIPLPDGIRTIEEANAVHERTDRVWTEWAPPEKDAFVRTWALRARELIDKYRPDLVYLDNFDLPFRNVGLEMAAHFYNANRSWHGGALEAVLNVKTVPVEHRPGIVEDVERGGKSFIDTYPWQTDTCLGNWHYDRALYERNGYKSAATVIHTLCDVVSKNGNLLVNVPVRGDGTIDDKAERIVEDIAAWMQQYAVAIYATRPWRVFGEGPTKPASGMFAEGGPVSPYTARDIRYVRKGDAVHALVLGWPQDGVVRLTRFARGSTIGRGEIARVTLPGASAPLSFRQTAAGLEVDVPESRRNPVGLALIISGNGLVDGSLAEA